GERRQGTEDARRLRSDHAHRPPRLRRELEQPVGKGRHRRRPRGAHHDRRRGDSRMSESWDFYFARVNGTLASLFVDLGLRPSVPGPDRPCLLWVFVEMRAPRPDGLSTSEEAPVLNQIEDALSAQLASALRGAQVGRVTTDGRRELYFYAPTAEGLPS